jgi:hypothetical protein
MRRSRGGDVSLPPPMPDQQAAAAAPQQQRGRGGVASIGRAMEIGGELDQLGDGAGGLAAMQRVNELLEKRGPLSKEFCLECVHSASSIGASQCSVQYHVRCSMAHCVTFRYGWLDDSEQSYFQFWCASFPS